MTKSKKQESFDDDDGVVSGLLMIWFGAGVVMFAISMGIAMLHKMGLVQ